MITKGIIKSKVVDSNKYCVEIPYLQQSSVRNNGVTESVLEATLSHTPGIINSYNEGDVVFIEFEDTQTSKPVIIGKLLVDENDNRGYAKLSSLNVVDRAILPEDTKIGDVDFKTISGDLEKLQFEIDNTDTDFVKDVLVNGESIVEDEVANVLLKTINNSAICGSGNIELPTKEYVDNKSNLIETTWSALKDLRDNSELLSGVFYRITDYTCTTTQTKTSSAGHQFDIIVRADDINKLNEVASAIQHSGDTYFSACKLDAWKIWYCLDNDTSRFNWADTTNGKGVIYRMIDEFNNEAPYDFKNILFTQNGSINVTTSSVTAVSLSRNKSEDINNLFCYSNGNITVYVSDVFPTTASVLKDASGEELPSSKINKLTIDYTDVYTFSGTVNNNIVDASLNEGNLKCLNNVIKEYNSSRIKQYLSHNVLYSPNKNSNFYHNVFEGGCQGNTILSSYLCSSNILHLECYANTFNIQGNVCYYNTLESYCYGNYFEGNCHTNTLGNGCYTNVFLIATVNKFGNDCYNNTFGGGSYNTFGNHCGNNKFGNNSHNNTFGNSCSSIISGNSLSRNIFGNYCYNITLGNSCSGNTFGNYCGRITFGLSGGVKDYYSYNIIDSGCSYIYLDSSNSTSSSAPLQNVHIHSGVKGSASVSKTITVASGLLHSMDVYAIGSETMNV